jgi:hypothetical protein
MPLSTNPVPRSWNSTLDHLARIADCVNNILKGKTNNVGDVTLTASSATTTITDPRIGANSAILMQPTTANAAAALSGLYFDTPGNGTVVVNHANNGQTDKTFKYVVVG